MRNSNFNYDKCKNECPGLEKLKEHLRKFHDVRNVKGNPKFVNKCEKGFCRKFEDLKYSIDEHRIEAHKEMINFQNNKKDESGTMAHKDKAYSQDNTEIMNIGDVTHVRDDEHRIQDHKDMVNDQDNTNNERPK